MKAFHHRVNYVLNTNQKIWSFMLHLKKSKSIWSCSKSSYKVKFKVIYYRLNSTMKAYKHELQLNDESFHCGLNYVMNMNQKIMSFMLHLKKSKSEWKHSNTSYKVKFNIIYYRLNSIAIMIITVLRPSLTTWSDKT